ncbi:MAG: hypothetical protein IBX56_13985 [Methylomicrobium sp.]|nr:hypothetical protein [Methylomicrobium sp.]
MAMTQSMETSVLWGYLRVRLLFGIKGGLDAQVIGNIVVDLFNGLHNQLPL